MRSAARDGFNAAIAEPALPLACCKQDERVGDSARQRVLSPINERAELLTQEPQGRPDPLAHRAPQYPTASVMQALTLPARRIDATQGPPMHVRSGGD